jgi:hypothetical protein
LDSLKEIDKRMEERSIDSDRMFLLSLLPAMKQLSPLVNLGFKVKIQKPFDENCDVLQLEKYC